MTPANSAEYLKPASFARYLAVDVRPRSFGFVVVENKVVLDSGIRMCEQIRFGDCLGQRFDRILRTYSPSAVILRGTAGLKANLKKREILTAIRQGAKQHGAGVVSVKPATISHYFRRYDATTKYQVAEVVATILPELAWKLPRKRRPWESEHYRMSIFDAAAVVIAHLELKRP
jgi:hypothetical protein